MPKIIPPRTNLFNFTNWSAAFIWNGGVLQTVTLTATNGADFQSSPNLASWTTFATGTSAVVSVSEFLSPGFFRVRSLAPATFAKQFGGTSYNYGQTLAVRDNGNILYGGTFAGTTDYGNGPLTSAGAQDFVLAEYAPSGACLWAQRFGGSGAESIVKLAATSNALFATGTFSATFTLAGVTLTNAGMNDLWLAKFTGGTSAASPTLLWAKRFGTAKEDNVRDLGVDAGGNVILCGNFTTQCVFGPEGQTGGLDFGCGQICSTFSGQDSFVARLDGGDGHCLWARNFNCGSPDYAQRLAVDGNAIYLLGQFQSDINLGCGLITAAGVPNEIYVAQLDVGDGHCVWSRSTGTGTPAAIASRNGIFVTGNHSEIFLDKLNAATGSTEWSRTFTGPSFEFSTALATDASGNIFTTGNFPNTLTIGSTNLVSPATSSGFIAKHDAAGSLVWAASFGGDHKEPGTEATAPVALAVDAAGRVLVTGNFSGALNGGGAHFTNDNVLDGFVVQFP